MTPVHLIATIYQGATFELALDRVTYPYPVIVDSYGVLRKADGSEAPETDRVEEDYVGSSARMQLRKTIDDPDTIVFLSTENDGIVLGGKRLTIIISDAETSLMSGWTNCIGHVEVVRSNGKVERQYEIDFTLSREATR